MARQPRNETEAGVHHVYARGVERRLIFGDDDDRRLYLRLLYGVAKRMRWRLLAVCLMPNHVHLLVETSEPNLGRGMHLVHGQYAQMFNKRYERVGHLFQSRFGSRVLHDEVQIATVAAYVVVNPVAAGLCADPGDWPWTRVESRRLNEHLASLGEPESVYSAFVESRLVSAGLPGLV